MAIGAPVSAMLAFLCLLAYRYRTGASKRLNSYLAEDGGQIMFSDFDSAQPFVDDQFRLGSHYLFIKNGAVLRLDSITDIVKTTSNYRMVPTGVYLTVIVKDENGRMLCPLCMIHKPKAAAEIDEIRKAVMQEHLSV